MNRTWDFVQQNATFNWSLLDVTQVAAHLQLILDTWKLR
jgi:hypothetical protein